MMHAAVHVTGEGMHWINRLDQRLTVDKNRKPPVKCWVLAKHAHDTIVDWMPDRMQAAIHAGGYGYNF
jgi:hypothetical protein